MGPSVKFVLTIIDAFPNQQNWGNFLCGKKDKPGGGEGLSSGRIFSSLSFPVSLVALCFISFVEFFVLLSVTQIS